MVVFLANRANLQSRRLHDRIRTRLRATFDDVRRRRAEPREVGPYRLVGDINPQQFLEDEDAARRARIEIGFQLQTSDPYEHYWINWIEPDRNMLVGWHQDDTHEDLGPVHLQVNDGATAVDHRPAQFIDSHPLDVVEQRLAELQTAVLAVEWNDGRPVRLDPSSSVIVQ